MHASKADKVLIVAHVENKLDPATALAHSRKVAAFKAVDALKYLVF